ncbi:flavin-containing monooxygenase [Pseudooceanicola sp. C21-150M6]|uniref:flavin-containing monooxygenase n=1 Tax=Pseudooceanicola sp. C21-150M6 TaxID=3434355 RepID=UPI003D7F798D
MEKTEVLVIGGGQAGIAMSEHLGAAGVAHLVLEKGRVAERWRSGRWDSLVANGPAWHDRFPGLEFSCPPEVFPGKEEVADYFQAYAEKIDAPVRTGVEVTGLTRLEGRHGFLAETTVGPVEAEYVVVATGPFQVPVIPQLVPESAGIMQMHSADYRNPDQLPEGGVLVVGAGSSGVQIAAELAASGRKTFLSVGPHGRPPRAYRGQDCCWWLGVLNRWDAERTPGVEHVTIAVSGARGGHTVDFRDLVQRGVTLVGRAEGFEGGHMTFAPDLPENMAAGDRSYLAVLDAADAYVRRNGLDMPEEPEARVIAPDPDCVVNPILDLDLAAAGVRTILWATGYTFDYSWMKTDAVDAEGQPRQLRGISEEPGIYFLGLPWLTRRASSFIFGVWHDASYIRDHILKRRAYLEFNAQS